MAHISNILIPALIFYIVAMGIVQKYDIYAAFTKGAKRGITTVIEIIPTLIGLMTAVGVLRASGFLDFVCSGIGRLIGCVSGIEDFPSELISLCIVKIFSSSAATGLALDIFKQYGTDSFAGLATSYALASTETVFYTLSVYFLSVRVTKARWAVSGALFATISGIIASIVMAYLTA